jgi:hypothetical protein
MGVHMWMGRRGIVSVSTNDVGSFMEGQMRTGATLTVQSVQWA